MVKCAGYLCTNSTRYVLWLQERWLRGDTRHHAVLKALPIFEAASAAGAAEPVFADLHTCTLAAPLGMPTAALEDSFVAVSLPAQREALACLGMGTPNHSTILRFEKVMRCCCLSSYGP